MSLQQVAFRGFANPVDPTSAELRAWAYQPDSIKMANMPPEWDLLVAGDPLINTLLDLALDDACPARRFALHCLYIYAADAIRTKFRAHPKRRLRKLVERAEDHGDDHLQLWAHNTRMLLAMPELFDYRDWCEGGLVRNPRRLRPPTAIAAGPAPAPPGAASSGLRSAAGGSAGLRPAPNGTPGPPPGLRPGDPAGLGPPAALSASAFHAPPFPTSSFGGNPGSFGSNPGAPMLAPAPAFPASQPPGSAMPASLQASLPSALPPTFPAFPPPAALPGPRPPQD